MPSFLVIYGFHLTLGLLHFDATFQNFIYKHTVDLENVQRNKKKEKGEITRCQNLYM